jgi:hypothetical protein
MRGGRYYRALSSAKEWLIVFHARVAAIADGLRASVQFNLHRANLATFAQEYSQEYPWVWVAWPLISGQADGRRDPAVQEVRVRGGWARVRPWRGET